MLLIPTILIMIAMHFKRHSYPLNAILLGIFTIFESYTVATICTT